MQNVPKLLNQWLLIDVLITIFIGVSLPTQLVAQSENWLIESPPVTDFVGSAAFDSAPDSLISRSTEAALGTGVFVHPVYYGEVFTNARGGISTNDATQYQALLNIPMAFRASAFNRISNTSPHRPASSATRWHWECALS